MKDKKNKKNLVSVIIANYNNGKYVERSINSILNQTYKNFKIIVVDDNSSDNSINVIKKYNKKIKLIQNKKKSYIGGYDQINSYYLGYLKADGNVICFLDSDDFFSKNKLLNVVNFLKKNKSTNLLFDKPIIYFNKKKHHKSNQKYRSTMFTPWPRFFPQSCITIKKKYLKKIFKIVKIRKFPTVWFDFRLATQGYLDFNKLYVINKHLTYYQQSRTSISSKYKKFSKNWWIRRKEAHSYMKYLLSINKKKKSTLSFDEIFTKFVNFFINQ